MNEIDNTQSDWTEAERAARRDLIRIGLIMITAITITGIIMAIVSNQLGTL